MSKELFVKNLLKSIDQCNVLNSVGFVQLPNHRMAKLTVSTATRSDTLPTSGTYRSVNVAIIDKNSGKIDSENFAFDDYLEVDKTKRTDSECFKVVEHCGWKWYILTPTTKSLKKYNKAINDYIKLFS